MTTLFIPVQIAYQDDDSDPRVAMTWRAQRRSSKNVISRSLAPPLVVHIIITRYQCYRQHYIHTGVRLRSEQHCIILRIHTIQHMSARSFCVRRHSIVTLCETPTGLYHADGEAVVVILQQDSEREKKFSLTRLETLTDMLCFPTLGVHLATYAAIYDCLSAGYYLRLARTSGSEPVHKFHLKVTLAIRWAKLPVSCTERYHCECSRIY